MNYTITLSLALAAMLALGDALALVASRMRAFGRADFARVHPAGSLGLQLSRVEERMRPLADCRVAAASHTVREVFANLHRPGRRSDGGSPATSTTARSRRCRGSR